MIVIKTVQDLHDVFDSIEDQIFESKINAKEYAACLITVVCNFLAAQPEHNRGLFISAIRPGIAEVEQGLKEGFYQIETRKPDEVES